MSSTVFVVLFGIYMACVHNNTATIAVLVLYSSVCVGAVYWDWRRLSDD